jgi:predicted dehydrogenase
LGKCTQGNYLPSFADQSNVLQPMLGVDLKSEQEASALLRQYPFVNYKRHDEALKAIRVGEIQPPEVILVVTDSNTHVQVILDILDALPKDACVLILAEKPLDVSLRRVKRLLKRLKNFNGRVKIRCIDHYLLKAGFRALRRRLPELLAQIEPLRYVTFEMHEAGLVGAGLKNLINGGIIFDHPPHGWAMLKRLLSVEKFSLGTTVRARCAEAPDALPRDVETAAITPFHAVTKWGEINGRVAVSKLTVDDKQLLLIGDKGTIRLDIRANEIDLLTNGHSTPIWGPQKARRESETLDAYPYLIQEILGGRAEEECTLMLAEGAQVVQLCEQSRNNSKWFPPYPAGEPFDKD